MNQYAEMIRNLKTPEAMERLIRLYGNRDGMLVAQTARYTRMLKKHEELFNVQDKPVYLVSAPGRTEIGGNHTDHNSGKVLAASVNLDTLAAVSARNDMQVVVHSEGYSPITVDLSDLSARKEEEGTTASLIRGVAARMKELGFEIGGFEAAVTSSVGSGSGLSSSAAFEVLISAIFDKIYNGWKVDYKTQAMISQYAENVYFGKPSGLLDQMASATGGLVFIDFKHQEAKVKPVAYDFAQKGYSLVVVNTGGSHAGLTDHYAAIPAEMRQVAACFGEEKLRQVRPEHFFQEIGNIRSKVSDRALMRAIHYFTENMRVDREVEAIEKDDMEAFKKEIIASGRSSFMYLQNVFADPGQQQLSLALSIAEYLLSDKGAWRVHGGGFAGTTLNFVPNEMLPAFIEKMDSVFGQRACQVLDIRPEGAACLDL
ncbi:MAG: galactokinase [Clostridia bacterium]|nr:galactokinase [Clostridia bacterium]